MLADAILLNAYTQIHSYECIWTVNNLERSYLRQSVFQIVKELDVYECTNIDESHEWRSRLVHALNAREFISWKTFSKNIFHQINSKVGGATRDRTADLLNANQALSQLSYSPMNLPFCAITSLFAHSLRSFTIRKLPRSFTSRLVLTQKFGVIPI